MFFLILYNKIRNAKSSAGFLASAKKNVNKMSEQLQSYHKEQERFKTWKAMHPEKAAKLTRPKLLEMFQHEELMKKHTEEYLKEKGNERIGGGGGGGGGFKMGSLFN